MDFPEYTKLLRQHPLTKAAKLDVEIVPIAYKSLTNQILKKGGERFFVAGINMATNNKAREKGILRAIFNDQSIAAARQRPQGCNFTCIDYQGDKNRKIVNMATRFNGGRFVQKTQELYKRGSRNIF